MDRDETELSSTFILIYRSYLYSKLDENTINYLWFYYTFTFYANNMQVCPQEFIIHSNAAISNMFQPPFCRYLN